MNRYLILGIALLVVCSSTTAHAQFGSWELGIDYPQDNEDVPFDVKVDGTASVVFFVSNEEIVDIVVEFEYEVPFEGEGEGPESETIGAGENKSFTLGISGIDVWSYAADSKEEFSIRANLVSRAGLPVGLPGENREATGELRIPTIYSLEVDISDPVGPMNAGSDAILRVSVVNRGNVQDKVGDVEITDNCPLLTTDNGLDSLMTQNIVAGQTVEADLVATASESHPRRNCKIEVSISSNGAMNSGESSVVSDETTLSVEPPLQNEEGAGGGNGGGETDEVSEVVSTSLPSLGIAPIVATLAVAAGYARKRSF
uniref:Uncharacterized protein n=1 Tax=uncultured marine group II/III euryarchaeote KM3_109_A02 TaxID=1457849 RepID=A0A075G6U2_9EURY|nr:hypothetical protein [uncultured marine group II/III euryarchaeote KM3_109_A02]